MKYTHIVAAIAVTLGFSLQSFAGSPWNGRWTAVVPPPDEATPLRISFSPLDDGRGVRYAEGRKVVFEAPLDGRRSPGANGETASYEAQAADDGSLAVRTVRDERTVRTQGLRVVENGNALLVSATSWDAAGKTTTEGYYYQRIADTECGIHVEAPPALPVYGCWLWKDGQQRLEHAPAPITIEEIAGGFRLSSPTGRFILRPGGKASMEGMGASPRPYSISSWKSGKQLLELTLAAGTMKAAGALRLQLTGADTLAVTVRNSNGTESSYTYRRQ